MKIVILDGYVCNPGDMSWDAFAELGNLTVYARTAPDEVVERCRDAQAVITNKTVIAREHLQALPDLQYIGVLATGVNVVDLAAASERDVAVTNIPAYGTSSVAQAVFALLLELTNRVGLHDHEVHKGAWCRHSDFSMALTPLNELAGRTFGIIGFGLIGRTVANIARAFGMHVLFHTRSTPEACEQGYRYLTLAELLGKSDIVSLHCPLTAQTTELINAATIAQMKDGAILINTGRGGLVNEADLAAALHSGKLAGAGVDVLSEEPPAPDNPLLSAPNCVITPHVAWATAEARARLIETAASNLRKFFSGEPVNVVTE